MDTVYFFALFSTVAFICLYAFVLQKEKKDNGVVGKQPVKQMLPLFVLLALGFLFKSYCTTFTHGHFTDTNCFAGWSDMIYNSGIGGFYYIENAFTDYPPGYMVVLYITAAFRHLFGITASGDLGIYLIKLVPMLFDLAAGFLIYKIARKRFSENSSLFLTAAFIFNPVIILNSSVWCQVDSVFTFIVLLTCYFCMEGKRIPAYFVFAIGILVKPQTVIFTPVLIFTIIEQVFLKDFNWKKFFTDLISGISAIIMMFLLAMPFGLEKVIAQYQETLGSYEYASVNAYNFWALLGQNWKPQTGKFLGLQYRSWGELAIVAAVVLGALVFFRLKEDKSKYFLSMTAIVCTMFLFSVRMHERYMYPAIALTLIGYVLSKRKEMFYCFIGFTLTQFINTAHVLYYNVEMNQSTWVEGKIINFTAIALILLFVYFIYSCLRKPEKQETLSAAATKAVGNGRRKQSASKQNEKKKSFVENWRKKAITLSKPRPKMKKADWCVLLGIMIVYSAFAFYDLGYREAPETSWSVEGFGQKIVIDLGEQKSISKIYAYLGNYENRMFTIEAGNDLSSMENKGDYTFNSVFNWEYFDKLEMLNCRYLRLTAKDMESVLMEMVLLDESGNPIAIPDQSSLASYTHGVEYLFDEQELFDKADTFRSGTYFDEIYHARTAYEMKEHLYNYENTHPPLGKFIISIGIRLFGMNPFGWRVMGTLMGVFMLPFMYLFGKRMFEKTWVAGVITSLFAFDFMHFTQTRIATIDVYGTFFIIAMYYFMYSYAQTSFHDTPLKKTWIPLGLSGLCMGLGVASKWTAVYAGIGLAFIFLYIMIIRYQEYRNVKQMTKANKEELSKNAIVENYKGNLIKTLGMCVIFFILVPCIIYLLSYIPFSDGTKDGLFTQCIRNQQMMFSYHSTLVAEHAYSSWWYEWPTMIRPVFYYCNTVADGLKEGISAFGNPLVWWTGIPALIYMVYLIIKKADRTAMFITFAYFAQLVPWMKVSRITFAYHYFPSVVFVVLMLGYCAKDFVKNKPERIKYVIGYALAAFLLFIMFYPVLSGQPIDETYVSTSLRWKGIYFFDDWLIKLRWTLTL